MKKNNIPFTLPDITNKEINAVTKVLKSGWLTTGVVTQKFEKKFAKYVGAKYAVAVNSGTAALHLALAAIGIQEKDEIVLPTMTFVATAEVITYFRAKPIFIDCEPDSLLMDVSKIEKKITKKTKAIIPVHYGGQACDIDQILKIAKRHKLKVIWDAAHSLPTKYKRKLVGAFPDITCFSFYVTKPLTTGEGGMAVTNDKNYAHKMKILSLHGMSRDAWNRYSKKGSWYYEIVASGFKYNLTDIAASLGLCQLRKCNLLWRKRKKIAERYNQAFKNLKEVELLTQKSYGTNAWHLYVIKLNLEKLGISRNQFIEKLKKKNIGTSVHFIPLHLMPFYQKKFGYKKGDFPIAEKVFKKIVSLPIYSQLTINQLKYVIKCVKEILKN